MATLASTIPRPLLLPPPLLVLLLSQLSPAVAMESRILPVVPWDDAGYQPLQVATAASRVLCGGRCYRLSEGQEPCVAISFTNDGQCRLLGCPPGHTATDGVCRPDCPAGTALIHGECRLQCQTGWKEFNNACYLRVATTKSWAESESYCKAQLSGAHLASIHSSQEETFVWNLMTTNGTAQANYHIGFEHLASEPAYTFHWVDGTPVGYTNWRSEQPNFDQTLPLGTSVYTSGQAWCDVNFDSSYNFLSVCKMAAPTGP